MWFWFILEHFVEQIVEELEEVITSSVLIQIGCKKRLDSYFLGSELMERGFDRNLSMVNTFLL